MYETTVDNLDTLLKGLSRNTKDAPYDIKIIGITKSQCGSSQSSGTIGYILLHNGGRYVSLNFDSFPSDATDTSYMFSSCSSLTSIDTSVFTKATYASAMFSYCSSLTSIDTSVFTNVTNASYMFSGCASLTSIDASNFVNITNASEMFSFCSSLTSINTSAFKKVTNAERMFANCSKLTSIDTSAFTKVTSASNMFANCSKLQQIDKFGFDTTKNIQKTNMFSGTNLTEIYIDSEIQNPYDGLYFGNQDKINVHNFIKDAGCTTTPTIYVNIDYHVPISTPCIYLNKLLTQLPENTSTSPYDVTITEITKTQCSDSWTGDTVGYILRHNSKKYVGLKFTSLPTSLTESIGMFNACSSLISIDTSAFTNVTNADDMFSGCTSLTSINTNGLTNVINAENMFNGCSKLTSIDASNFVNITNASEMFSFCSSLTSINTSAFKKVTNAERMFANCSKLTSIDTSNFVNINVASKMFKNCTSIKSINTSVFTRITDASEMFFNCSLITSIDISAFKNVTNATEMFYACSALKTITGWNFSRDCDVTSMLNNTPSDLKISVIHPDAKERNGFSFIKVHTTTGKKTVTYKSLSNPDAENITIDVPSAIGDKITFYNKNDEICVSSEITDETFNKMAEYRYPWNSSNGTLDPSKKNFVLWADSESNVVTNVGGGDSGIIPIKRGGTNAKTELEASYNLFKDIPGSTGDIDENTQFQFHYVTPSETKGSFYYRKSGKIWDWVKGKADALYLGKTAKASSASTADSATNLKVTNHDTNNTTYYPIWANGKGDGSTARGTYTSTDLNYVPATGNFKSKKYTVDKKVDLEWNATTNSLDFKFL